METPGPLFDASADASVEIVRGFEIRRRMIDADAQRTMLSELAAIVASAPLVRPLTPWGKPMTVSMTSAGAVGWVTDRKGYRYEATHPETGLPWPPIPESLLAVWRACAPAAPEADSCLINHYREGARMGLHQDKDEADFDVPVVSISLGDPCVFRMGGRERKGSTESVRLRSGDVVVIGGEARLAFHGVDRILFGADDLLADHPTFAPGRINVTLRRAAPTS